LCLLETDVGPAKGIGIGVEAEFFDQASAWILWECGQCISFVRRLDDVVLVELKDDQLFRLDDRFRGGKIETKKEGRWRIDIVDGLCGEVGKEGVIVFEGIQQRQDGKTDMCQMLFVATQKHDLSVKHHGCDQRQNLSHVETHEKRLERKLFVESIIRFNWIEEGMKELKG